MAEPPALKIENRQSGASVERQLLVFAPVGWCCLMDRVLASLPLMVGVFWTFGDSAVLAGGLGIGAQVPLEHGVFQEGNTIVL